MLNIVESATRITDRDADTGRLDAGALPLCVDLDGTLVLADTLHECAAALARDPRALASVPALLWRGKAALKRELAQRANIAAPLLPYRSELLDYLQAEKARGRTLVLCTAADLRIARDVADHLGLFDRVIASDGTCNLRGPEKAAALVAEFGEGGFVYAGNDRTDLEVWRHAAAGILVGAPASVRSAAANLVPIEAEFPPAAGTDWGAVVRALRPHQWSKNVLVFVPLFTSGDLWNLTAWLSEIDIFVSFCCVASMLYILNDIQDLDADRSHPRKRMRPFASGAVPIRTGVWVASALGALGVTIAALSGSLIIILLYVLLSGAYSIRLKELPLVDVFTLAALYTLRVFAGGEASEHLVSHWLLAFSSFIFLSLAIAKRVAELSGTKDRAEGKLKRRGYRDEDLQILSMMGICAAFVSVLVLALYIQSEGALTRYTYDFSLWPAVFLILLWLCRVWLAVGRGRMHDDPIVFAFRDRVSWMIGGATVMAIMLSLRVYP